MTQAEYARHRGVSREAVRKALADGRIRADARGLIDPAAADAAWRVNTDPARGPGAAAAPPGGPPAGAAQAPAAVVAAAVAAAAEGDSMALPEGLTLTDARAVREWNAGVKLFLERRQLAGELVEVAKVEDAAFRAARTTRDLLMALPDRLDAELAAISDPGEVNRRLTEELRRICDEFAIGLQQDPDVEEAAS